MNSASALIIVFAMACCQHAVCEQTPCPPSGVAAQRLTTKQLSQRATRKVQPTLPSGFGRIDSTVVVTILVDERGTVTCARGADDSHPILRKYSEEAAQQWQFKPLLIRGKPVPITGRLSFHLKR